MMVGFATKWPRNARRSSEKMTLLATSGTKRRRVFSWPMAETLIRSRVAFSASHHHILKCGAGRRASREAAAEGRVSARKTRELLKRRSIFDARRGRLSKPNRHCADISGDDFIKAAIDSFSTRALGHFAAHYRVRQQKESDAAATAPLRVYFAVESSRRDAEKDARHIFDAGTPQPRLPRCRPEEDDGTAYLAQRQAEAI